jgi:hypothetical protein
MQAEIVLRLFAMACFLMAVVAALYMQRSKVVQITDYQAGLRFRGGCYRVLGPGCYREGPGLGPITVVDMRPRQFILERMPFQDALHAPSILSVAGELVISDPGTATNTFKNILEDSVAMIREGLCPAASRSIVDPSEEGRKRLVADITATINRTLEPNGVMLRSLEITELWTRPVRFTVAGEAN